MKKEFYAVKILANGTKELEKKEGDYDARGVFFHKESDGWAVTDSYTGSGIIGSQPTKEDAKKTLAQMMPKVKNLRQSEGYLKAVINYQEKVANAN